MDTAVGQALVALSAAFVFLFMVRTSVAIGDWRTRRRLAKEMERLKPRVLIGRFEDGQLPEWVQP